MTCSTGCSAPGTHATWGECVRSKRLKTATIDVSSQKAFDRNLDRYESARRQGIQPATTQPADIQRAVSISEKTGEAFQA